LSLYAVCGLLWLPLLRLPTSLLAVAGGAVVVLSFVIPVGDLLPGEESVRRLAVEATRVYAQGRFAEVLAFHLRETRFLILPILASSLLRTCGLMGLGAAAWRAGVFREPQRHRRLLWTVALAGGIVGGSLTAVSVYSASTGDATPVPQLLVVT